MAVRRGVVVVCMATVLVFCLYNLILHQKLPAKDQAKIVRSRTLVGYDGRIAAQVASIRAVQEATKEELRIAARTRELADEVVKLAHDIEDSAQKRQQAQQAAVHRDEQLAAQQAQQLPVQLGQKAQQHLQKDVGGVIRAATDMQALVHPTPTALRADLTRRSGTNPVSTYKGATGKALEPRHRDEWLPLLEPTVQDAATYAPLTLAELDRRRAAVRAAAEHSWQAYVRHAWGMDELMPLTQRGKNTFGGLGATIVDSLDTLWLLDMEQGFAQARQWVAESLQFDRAYDASTFETTIRVVGGLLSAYELSGDRMFLDKSEELSRQLLRAWDTPTGIPFNTVNLKTGVGKNPSWTMRGSTLSEYGTEQLEFITLSSLTGNATYGNASEHVIWYLRQNYPEKGLMPLYIHPGHGKFTTQKISMGALGDSYYEYLLKVWLLKGKADDLYRAMWEQAMDAMIASLLYASSPSRLKYIADYDRGRIKHKMDHLGCFIPAMLALGVQQGAVQGDKAKQYLSLAEDLAYTCWKMYSLQPTGLSPEFVNFEEGKDMQSGVHHYLLRPEAMEAMYLLWCVTKEEKYREWGWTMFMAFEQHCKVEHGYAGVKDVRHSPCQNDNTMQSFWLAETLKYLYLMFSQTDLLPIDTWVFNTEAHPLRVRRPSG